MRLARPSRGPFSHLGATDLSAISFAAILLGPYWLRLIGIGAELPFGLSASAFAPIFAAAFLLVFATGLKLRKDGALARLAALLLVLLPGSLLFGWLTELRADAFFTRDSLHQVSAVMLSITILSGLLERNVARGTPSDVFATSTGASANVLLAGFWLATAANQHYVAAALLLLTGILTALTLVLRVPGAIVPIYRVRKTRRRRKLGQEE